MKKFNFFILLILVAIFTTNPLFAATAKTSDWKSLINWTEILKGIASILAVIIGFILNGIKKYVSAKLDIVEMEKKNKLEKMILKKVKYLIVEIIESQKFLLQDRIKEILADGKVTEEEKKQFIEDVKKELIKVLGESGLKELEDIFGDSKVWLEKKIASFLSEKQAKQS